MRYIIHQLFCLFLLLTLLGVGPAEAMILIHPADAGVLEVRMKEKTSIFVISSQQIAMVLIESGYNNMGELANADISTLAEQLRGITIQMRGRTMTLEGAELSAPLELAAKIREAAAGSRSAVKITQSMVHNLFTRAK